MKKTGLRSITVTIGMCVFPAIAAAHPGHGASGLFDGLSHPLAGIDHLLAMIAVGLWAAQLGAGATWRVPLGFVAFMLVGASLAFAGVPLPMAETWIATSVLAMGLLVATARRFATPVAVMIVGAMALAHGHAHGIEMAAGSTTIAYAGGFVVSTALLHLCGVAMLRGLNGIHRDRWTRWIGAGMGGVGACLLMAAV